VFVDVLVVNQLLNPLAYARDTFDNLYGRTLQAFSMQVTAAEPPVERLYGPPLAAVAYRNHALQTRVPTTYGYNPLELADYAAYAEAAAQENSRLIGGFAANYQHQDARLVPLGNALPVAYFAQNIVAVADQSAARAALADLDPATTTLVTGTQPQIQADPLASVTLLSQTEDGLTLRYTSATPNLLRVAIPAYPGWRATLDGSDLQLVTVDEAFIGIFVPPGSGQIQLDFTPRLFWLAATISGLALLLAAGLLLRDRLHADPRLLHT
jgi:hypothetical protein